MLKGTGENIIVKKAAQILFFLLLIFPFNGEGYQNQNNSYVNATSSFVTHDVGNVALTVTNFGCLGYYNYVVEETPEYVGEGFQYPLDSPNVLHHGSLLVAQNFDQVSDCCYGNLQHNCYDWVPADSGDMIVETNISDMDVVTKYNDSNAENPIGLSVTQCSYSWENPPDDNYVIIEYEVENSSGSFLFGIYIGLYMDWDIGQITDNVTGYDFQTRCGYFWNETSKYYGICLLSPDEPTSYRAILNTEYVFQENSDEWFPEENKFLFMTDGIRVTGSDHPDDWSQLMSVGPFELEDGEKVKAAFAILGGEDWRDIIQSANNAKEKYVIITTINHENKSEKTPVRFSLFQNYPNPFNPGTEIKYQLAHASNVSLMIYNALGQRVLILVEGKAEKGFYQIYWNGCNEVGNKLPAGIYFIRLKAGRFFQSRKVALVR